MQTKNLKKLLSPINIFVAIVLLLAFILRLVNINNLLAFHYDQGRDALVIWDFLYNHKLFLIGPTTGLAGIFRGPYYYLLIAPFYFLGHGNPIYPAVFLVLTSVGAIWLMYYLTLKFQDKQSAIFALILASFSFYIVMAARWLSNPTPMMLLSMVLVWSMYLVVKGKQYGWVIMAVVSGLSLFNFGSSGELYYFPAILLFLILNWKNRPSLKTSIVSVVLFSFTFLPLVIFDIKHDGILRSGMSENFVKEKSFTWTTQYLLENRTKFYYDSFSTKIFHSRGKVEVFFLVSLFIALLYFLPSLSKNKFTRIIVILFFAPLIGLYFYQGNYKVLYDYYMTGYYLIFMLLVGLVLGKIWKLGFIGKTFIIIFLLVFLRNNYDPLSFKLLDKSNGPNSIAFINQNQAIDYIIKDADETEFNVDVYVPPVIPYSYDYLLTWKQPEHYLKEKNVKLLYTLYEKDSDHAKNLQDWLDRQEGIGEVVGEVEFGGIVVQKRERFDKVK